MPTILTALAVLLFLGGAAAAVPLLDNPWIAAAVYVLCDILCSELHRLIHELGHLLGGWCSGYRFLSFRAGPFLLTRSGDGWALRLERGWCGQCVMIPQGDRPRFRRYNLGGMAGNLLAGAAGLLLFRSCAGAWRIFCLTLFLTALPKLLQNGIPQQKDGYPNDAYLVRLLSKSGTAFQEYRAYLLLYEARALGRTVTAPDLPADGEHTLYYDAIQELLREKGE